MTRVAKLMLRDRDNKYLLLIRSKHPAFPYDPDLPGGTLEDGENPTDSLIREVLEETGIVLDPATIEKVYQSSDYDEGFMYYLYEAVCEERPTVAVSWEHSRYEWLDLEGFAAKAHSAIDNYMHMVYDYVCQNNSRPPK